MYQKILINKDRKYYVKDITKDFHCQDGYFSKKDLKKTNKKIKTSIKKEFTIINPTFTDIYNRLKRGPQIMTRKDIGIIIAETGIGKDSKVVDAGGGTGALSLMLANIVKKVTTYELREDFTKIVKYNIKLFGFKNITVKNKDINQITEKNLDLVTLDLPEPWKPVDKIAKALKPGAFLVSYNPNLDQVKKFINSIEKSKEFIYLKTLEIIKRGWEIDKKRLRPKNFRIGHTGFLTFVRKI